MKMVRGFFEAAQIPGYLAPYDTIQMKILYPAKRSGNDLETNMGIMPVDSEKAPFPVIIFFNGFNCEAQQYEWLGVKLAECGMVVVLFNWVMENLPGIISMTPGITIENRLPENYRTAPTAAALPALLTKLENLQNQGILAGMLDLQRIILGGHSEGGRVAIENTDPKFFRQVKAAFSYGAHNIGMVMFGYPPDTILALPDSLPLLLIGGTCDGVIAQSSSRYGKTSQNAVTPIIRTFDEAIAGGRNDSYLLLLEGANHFAITETFYSTTARYFLDFPSTQPQEKFHLLMAEIITLFIDTHVRQNSESSQKLEQLLNTSHPLIKSFERK